MSSILVAAVASSLACPLPGALELPTDLGDEVCMRDEDGNGLDDAVEEALARCVVPEIRFDAREEARSDGEPRALFNVRRLGHSHARVDITLLFAEDGGFPRGLLCRGRDAHHGDTETSFVDVELEEGAEGVKARIVGVDAGWPDGPSKDFTYQGTHPVLFASTNKHHLYFAPYEGPFLHPVSCQDLAKGDGVAVIPPVEHVPIFSLEGPHAPAPLTPDRMRWYNACLVARHPDDPAAWRVAARLRTNRFLPGEAFVGEEIEGATFRGSPPQIVTPIWRTLAIDRPPWRDGAVELFEAHVSALAPLPPEEAPHDNPRRPPLPTGPILPATNGARVSHPPERYVPRLVT